MSTDLPANESPENEDAENEAFLDDDGVLYDDDVTPEYGVLGFTVRELSIVGVWLVAFVVSFFPLIAGTSIWSSGIQWILPIGVPTAAVFLIVLRRFSPDGIRRVGSLGIDQFASVAFSVAAVTWVSALWSSIASTIEFGVWTLNWVGIVSLIAALALVALTVFAPIIPGLAEDFHGRLVTLAHRNANPVRPVVARPRTERTGRVEPASDLTSGASSVDDAPSDDSLAPAPAVVPGESSNDDSAPATRRPLLDGDADGAQATDEIARLDLPVQVPLASHASGGGTGTEEVADDAGYTPAYSRRSRQPEIISDTGAIESFLDEASVPVDGPGRGAEPVTEAIWSADSEPAPSPSASVSPSVPAGASDPVPSAQPFWILAPTERDVYDERGEAIYRIGPTAWALVIEDRGGAFVVRHDDGRIGYLHDIADISKG